MKQIKGERRKFNKESQVQHHTGTNIICGLQCVNVLPVLICLVRQLSHPDEMKTNVLLKMCRLYVLYLTEQIGNVFYLLINTLIKQMFLSCSCKSCNVSLPVCFILSIQVLDLISSDNLNVPSEEEVYRAVLSWVKHDIDGRRQHVPWVRLASPHPR